MLIYGHDTFGLGHLRRNLAIANHLSRTLDDLTILIITGSPVAGEFTLAPGVDYVKLPAVIKTDAATYESRSLLIDAEHVQALRTTIITETALGFSPDVVLVDHSATGLRGELTPALRVLAMQTPRPKLVLGLRDIVDDPQTVHRAWSSDGTLDALERWYDRILIYGQRDLFDAELEYGFEPAIARKTSFCGYIRRPFSTATGPELRASVDLDARPFVLVTVGGGGDGVELIDTVLEIAPKLRDRFPQLVIVTGPLMDEVARARFAERGRALCDTRVLDFHADVPGLMRESALTIGMGGYNTTCELLAAGTPAVVVPRVSPRREQLIRAERLQEQGLIAMLPQDRLSPQALIDCCERAIRPRSDARLNTFWDDRGLPKLAREIDALFAPVTEDPQRFAVCATR